MKNFKYTLSNNRPLPVSELTEDILVSCRAKRDLELDSGNAKSYVMNDCFICTPGTYRTRTQLTTVDDVWCSACGRNYFEGHDLTDYSNFVTSVEIPDVLVTEETLESIHTGMTEYVKTKTNEHNEVSFEQKKDIYDSTQITFPGITLFALGVSALVTVIIVVFGNPTIYSMIERILSIG
jgi:hypothetical protein